ncbi:HNH endonuclease [Scleromatobacter humisilvae]|uniref:HNH endonuclease n=1 Tax=Scleromatobacter humisilvae TaxID=2897159 RepID=A0A9X2BYH3_9BURK|nr:HNH endonuclease [Scleromatobacter humisilvae]MCK9685397.1 HNH endonuclease [Scleromatobacter humisilvae]
MQAEHHHHVLQLDIQGTPQAWISIEQAASHYATGSVAWEEGEGPLRTLRGGWNAVVGRQSVMDIHPIIALSGASRVNLFDVTPAVNKTKLLRRDRMTCAYCGQSFRERDLQCEHILPESRGGAWSWMNLVTACAWCNGRKADRTPEEARMPLMYLPYVPSRFEDFLLAGRNIRADVHDWLAARLPKASRLN